MPLSREEKMEMFPESPSGDPRSALATGLGAETSAAFTPGSWVLIEGARRNNAGACGANYKTHSRELLINGADGRPVISRRGLARPSKPDGAANARLIAAAPELYHALKAIRSEQAEGYCCDATRALADAALAKADGQS